jgi:hypothetical protein
MAFKLKDRVKETTSTTGDGAAISLAGAESGFLAFSSAFSNNDTTYYTLVSGNGSDWEVGIGSYVSSGNQFSRGTVISNNSGNTDRISLTGTSTIFVTHPADKTSFSDPSHTPASSGVAFWHNEKGAVGYDSDFVWDSGNSKLKVAGKASVDAHSTNHVFNTPKAGAADYGHNVGASANSFLDCNKSNYHTVTLDASSIYIALSGVDLGQKILIRLTQDGVGNRKVIWEHAKQVVRWPNGNTPNLTNYEDRTDVFGLIPVSGEFPSQPHDDDDNFGITYYNAFIIGRNIAE